MDVFAAESSDDQALTRRLEAYRWLFTSVTVSPGSPVNVLVMPPTALWSGRTEGQSRHAAHAWP
ncbi:hypothetical protein [Kibdelosporangium phytohabitans]|uniref:Uncharacterized protein n=1 Tax=Kibdelosporangium phytohabitans TaxID=860235 RepID=A0A0N9HYE9_9PSEU|nr:hypothetical protein [Kibdelosporangium phytohabitans]ALG10467.1 hypothetical protein AOZ06_29430 [Kibdelosporangium phytohabitans]MBE1461547.1 hypothetical protein [Kibdelosporangium phytohabitans]